MRPITELARAKVNLTLHVTSRRADGYHTLDSLVVFPDLGDLIEVEEAETLSLTVDGIFAQGLGAGADNLVIRAAEALRQPGRGAAIRLTKSLPVASGIGGGSADAAATLRALSRLWDVPLEGVDLTALGADVPVCLRSTTLRMQGIGERLSHMGALPEFWLVLVNPMRPVATPAVFQALESLENPSMSPMPATEFDRWAMWLRTQRNDLEAPALALEPVIGTVLDELAKQEGCALARMSGSGATCFGLFAEQETALAARARISKGFSGWWCVASPVRH